MNNKHRDIWVYLLEKRASERDGKAVVLSGDSGPNRNQKSILAFVGRNAVQISQVVFVDLLMKFIVEYDMPVIMPFLVESSKLVKNGEIICRFQSTSAASERAFSSS